MAIAVQAIGKWMGIQIHLLFDCSELVGEVQSGDSLLTDRDPCIPDHKQKMQWAVSWLLIPSCLYPH